MTESACSDARMGICYEAKFSKRQQVHRVGTASRLELTETWISPPASVASAWSWPAVAPFIWDAPLLDAA